MRLGQVERYGLIVWLGFETAKATQIIISGSGAVPHVMVAIATTIMLVNTMRRAPASILRADFTTLLACVASLGLLSLALWPLAVPPPTLIGQGLQWIGAALMVWSAWVLGRSFTFLPAAVRPVAHGPYRLVRHPLYAAYLLTDIGIALETGAATVWAALALEFVAFSWRAMQEERVLSALEPAYARYLAKVRGRFIPVVL